MICWGILGAGNIAGRFAKSLQFEKDARLLAVSCRTLEKAEQFARTHGAERAYDSYDALLADLDVDAVYLSLPHGLHLPWVLRALEAGKAVLCEKPAALNEAQVRQMIQAAEGNHLLFMEAMKPRFVPLYDRLRALIRGGAIGQLRRIEASLCNEIPFEALGMMGKTYHTLPGQGGALLDEGVYCASWLAAFTEGEITLTHVDAALRDDVDNYVNAELQAGPISLRLEAAFDRAKPRTARLIGTEGELLVQELHRPQTAELRKDGALAETLHAPYVGDDFYGEIHHFTQCLKKGLLESPVMPWAASLRCAGILDIIRGDF